MSMLCFGCLRCPQVAKKSILGHMSTERFLLLLLLLFIFLSASNFFQLFLIRRRHYALCIMTCGCIQRLFLKLLCLFCALL